MKNNKITNRRRESVFKENKFRCVDSIILPNGKEHIDDTQELLKQLHKELNILFKDNCPECSKMESCEYHSNILQSVNGMVIDTVSLSEAYKDMGRYSDEDTREVKGVDGFIGHTDNKVSGRQNKLQKKFEDKLIKLLIQTDGKEYLTSTADNLSEINSGLSLNQILFRDLNWTTKEKSIDFNIVRDVPKSLSELAEGDSSFKEDIVEERAAILNNWELQIKSIGLIINVYDDVYFKHEKPVKDLYEGYENIEITFNKKLTHLSNSLTDGIYSNLICVKDCFSKQYDNLRKENENTINSFKKGLYSSEYKEFIKNIDLNKLLDYESSEWVNLTTALKNLITLKSENDSYELIINWLGECEEPFKYEFDLINQMTRNALLLNETFNYFKNVKEKTDSTKFGTNLSEQNESVIGMFSEYLTLKETVYNVIFSNINKKMNDFSDEVIKSNKLSENNAFTKLASASAHNTKLQKEFTKKAESKGLEYKLITEYNFATIEEAEESIKKHILNKINAKDIVGLIDYVENSFKVNQLGVLRFSLKKDAINYANSTLDIINELEDKQEALRTVKFFYELGNYKLGVKLLEGISGEGGVV